MQSYYSFIDYILDAVPYILTTYFFNFIFSYQSTIDLGGLSFDSSGNKQVGQPGWGGVI